MHQTFLWCWWHIRYCICSTRFMLYNKWKQQTTSLWNQHHVKTGQKDNPLTHDDLQDHRHLLLRKDTQFNSLCEHGSIYANRNSPSLWNAEDLMLTKHFETNLQDIVCQHTGTISLCQQIRTWAWASLRCESKEALTTHQVDFARITVKTHAASKRRCNISIIPTGIKPGKRTHSPHETTIRTKHARVLPKVDSSQIGQVYSITT